jgi:hypothetical protein
MELRKVIFICYQPLTEKFEKDFFIKDLESARLEVEYWDLTTVYFEKLRLQGQLQTGYIRVFHSMAQFKTALKERREDSLFMVAMTYSRICLSLMRSLTRMNAFTGFFARGMQPFPFLEKPRHLWYLDRIRALWNVKKIASAAGNSLALVMKRLGLVKPYDILFTAGSEGFFTIGLGAVIDLKRAKIVEINTIDVDLSREVIDEPSPIREKFIVFLDDFLPHHPDFKIFGIETVGPERYYSGMNAYFSHLEAQRGIPVVIAAHPKSEYTQNPFQGRTIIRNRTNLLIRHSELVIAHSSTAISYAVIFEKPLILVYESEMLRIYGKTTVPLIVSFGRSLNAPVVDLENGPDPLPVDARVDKKAYEAYKYKFLTTPEAEHQRSSDLVIGAIKTIRFPL